MVTRKVSPEGRGENGQVSRGVQSRAEIVPSEPPVDPRSRYERFMDGDLKPEDLTLSELTKGRFADNDGGFRGRPKDVIPRKMLIMFTRELQFRMNGRFRELTMDAIDTVAEVMYDGEGEQTSQFTKKGTKRLDAAKYVIERVIGKIPDKVEISADVTVWQGLQEGDGLLVDIGDDDEIVAEIVEDVREEAPPAPRRRSPRTAQRRPPVA